MNAVVRHELLDLAEITKRGARQSRASCLIKSFDTFAREDLPTDQVAQSVRNFYEQTEALDLRLTADWVKFWYRLYRVVRFVLRLEAQLDFPLDQQDLHVKGELRALPNDRARTLQNVVTWSRSWNESAESKVMYSAIHATHLEDGETYMDFCLPMRGGALSIALRLTLLHDRPGGISLTSFADGPGQRSGCWFLTRHLQVPIPIKERVEFWPVGDAARAEHRFYIFGHKFLTLHYTATYG